MNSNTSNTTSTNQPDEDAASKSNVEKANQSNENNPLLPKPPATPPVAESEGPQKTISASPYHHKSIASRAFLLRQKQSENKPNETRAQEISDSHSDIFLFFWNAYASLAVFATMLVRYESMFGLALTIMATLICWYEAPAEDSGQEWSGQMDTVLLSFAVITPLSSSISMAFTRRDNALRHMALFRSAAYNIYVAHSTWDWGECWKGKGRRGCKENIEDEIAAGTAPAETTSNGNNKPIDFLQHSDNMLRHIIHLSDSLEQYLTLPNGTRARHRVTAKGKNESKNILSTARSLFTMNVSGRMIMISQLCEALKYRGLPGNEASRIRQWENVLTTAMEELRMVKEYRTPQALRIFGRIFTLILPPLYAPTYVEVARNSNSLALGLVVGIVTSMALTGLFECVAQLEDPFVAHVTLDGIDVREELKVLVFQELMMARAMIFPGVEEFDLKVDGSKSVRVAVEEVEKSSPYSSICLDRTSKHEFPQKNPL